VVIKVIGGDDGDGDDGFLTKKVRSGNEGTTTPNCKSLLALSNYSLLVNQTVQVRTVGHSNCQVGG
jgi:hypothetical protein